MLSACSWLCFRWMAVGVDAIWQVLGDERCSVRHADGVMRGSDQVRVMRGVPNMMASFLCHPVKHFTLMSGTQ